MTAPAEETPSQGPLRCLVDTNILVRSAQPNAPEYPAVTTAVVQLLRRGAPLFVTPQNLIEFWSAATRPPAVNGLGMSPAEVLAEVERIVGIFDLLPDTADIFPEWLALVSGHGVSGRQVHDARLAAVMRVHQIPNLLTLNPGDFRRYGIAIITPSDVLAFGVGGAEEAPVSSSTTGTVEEPET